MPLLNPLNEVWNNLLTIGVLAAVGYWLWRNLEENKFKDSVRELIERMKGE